MGLKLPADFDRSKLPHGRGVNMNALAVGAVPARFSDLGGDVEVPIPPSTNDLWRAVRNAGKVKMIKSRGYTGWLAIAVPLARMGLPAVRPPVGVRIVVRGGKGWNPQRDVDNTIKSMLDCLRHAQRIADDNTEWVTDVWASYRPAEPGRPAGCVVSFFVPEVTS